MEKADNAKPPALLIPGLDGIGNNQFNHPRNPECRTRPCCWLQALF